MLLYPKAKILYSGKSQPCWGSDRNDICCLHALGRDGGDNTSAMWVTKKQAEELRSLFSM